MAKKILLKKKSKEETPLEKARRVVVENREAGIITVRRNPIQIANECPSSLRKAIKAMCYHCFGGTKEHYPDPGWRLSIKECTSYDCPLRHQRPYQNLVAKDEDEDVVEEDDNEEEEEEVEEEDND